MVKRKRHREGAATRPSATAPPAVAVSVDTHPATAAPTALRTAAPQPGTPPPGARRVTGPTDAQQLASHLLDVGRRYPVVVVTIPSGQRDPWIDAAGIADAVRGLAEVVVLPTDASSWAFSAALPEMTQVYGGAGRVYPVGNAWAADWTLSPLRFAYGPADADRATDLLVGDAMGMARAAGPSRRSDPQEVRSATGVVRRLVEPSRALVQLDDGGLATIWQELTIPGVTISQFLAPAQPVQGILDHESRLDITAGLRRGAGQVAHYRVGDVVLAKVTAVRADVVHLALHPDVVVPVPKDRVTTNPADSMRSLFTVDEIVVARVAWRDGTRPMLRLDDVDDEDLPVPAPALLDGGPPWLTPPAPPAWEPDEPVAVPLRAEPTRAPTPAGLTPAAVPVPSAPRGAVRSLSLTLDAAEARVTELERALASSREEAQSAGTQLENLRQRAVELEERAQRLAEQVAAQKAHLRTEKQRSQKAARRSDPTAAPPAAPLFTDAVAQLEHEVYVEWATRIPAGEKTDRPLKSFALGPDFLTSLDELEGIERRKVVQVVVEVLTGLAEQLDSRQVHPLRRGPAGNSPQVVRDGGWKCWRVALQRETPGARRLHYWTLSDKVELSRVALHDDMRP